MRRLVPLALVAVVTAGAGFGAALGAVAGPGVTPSEWVAGLLSSTANAGSAHFVYAHVTTSPNPTERDTILGSGEVDFANGSFQVTEVDRQAGTTTTDKEIGIGTAEYQSFLPQGPFPRWTKLPWQRDPHAALGLSSAENAAVALSQLQGLEPIAAVRDLGSVMLAGERTTRYSVTNTPLTLCPGEPRPTLVSSFGPTMVWVDGRGRLVQARLVVRLHGHLPSSVEAKLPALARTALGPATTVATLRLSDFGTTVRVTMPRVQVVPHSSGGSFSIALRHCSA